MMRRAIISLRDREYRLRVYEFNLEQGKQIFGRSSQLYGQADTANVNRTIARILLIGHFACFLREMGFMQQQRVSIASGCS